MFTIIFSNARDDIVKLQTLFSNTTARSCKNIHIRTTGKMLIVSQHRCIAVYKNNRIDRTSILPTAVKHPTGPQKTSLSSDMFNSHEKERLLWRMMRDEKNRLLPYRWCATGVLLCSKNVFKQCKLEKSILWDMPGKTENEFHYVSFVQMPRILRISTETSV